MDEHVQEDYERALEAVEAWEDQQKDFSAWFDALNIPWDNYESRLEALRAYIEAIQGYREDLLTVINLIGGISYDDLGGVRRVRIKEAYRILTAIRDTTRYENLLNPKTDLEKACYYLERHADGIK